MEDSKKTPATSHIAVGRLNTCPFCGVHLYSCTYDGGKTRYAHEVNGCILDRKFVQGEAQEAAWNRRPAPGEHVTGADLADCVDKATAWDQCVKSSQRAREKAIEEAAKIAETGDWYGDFQTAGDERRAKDIAARIRALSAAEGSEG